MALAMAHVRVLVKTQDLGTEKETEKETAKETGKAMAKAMEWEMALV
tara:strand:- start:707 stop:847 length:141 start_codon:yes stop_codon:yes gene_type:complete